MSRTNAQGLAGASVLVTGGGSGIGLACAQRLAADGASVTLVGRSEDRLKAGVAAVEAAAAEARGDAVPPVLRVAADITDEAAVEAAVAAATAVTGTLDGIVSSAGGSETIGPITQIDVEAWRRTVDLNLTGTMLTIKHGARVMARQGHGSIVAISSMAGGTTHRWFGAYGPAKAGLEMLCMVAADELGASGVRVNTVRPGLTNTDLVEAITAPGPVRDDYLDCMPLGPRGRARGRGRRSCGSSSVPRPRGSPARTSASTAATPSAAAPTCRACSRACSAPTACGAVVPEA